MYHNKGRVELQRCVSTTHYIKIMWHVWGGMHTGFWWGNPKNCSEDRGMYERILLKRTFKQTNRMAGSVLD